LRSGPELSEFALGRPVRQLETRLDKYFSLVEVLFHRLVPKHELWSVSDVILQGPGVANGIEPPHSNFMVELSCPHTASPQTFLRTTKPSTANET
jgi:hypothetical protein